MAEMPDNEHERALREQLKAMQEDQVIDLVRETIVQLGKLADRLEEYTKVRVVPGETPTTDDHAGEC